MKRIMIIAAMLFALQIHAESDKTVKSTVKKVTIYTQGAQVFRTAGVTLTPGVTNLVFNGVSKYINPSSIQAGGKGSFVVLDVKHNIKYPEPPKPATSELPKEILKEIALMEDSLAELTFLRDDINERKSALQLEKDMILKNKLVRGDGKSDSLPVLKQAMDFFHTKLSELNILLARIKREELTNNTKLSRVTARLAELRTYKNSEEPQNKYEPINQVIVSVSCEEATTGFVDISYMVTQAGWVPSYDLRSVTAAAPIQLTYKANVYQNTGEEWNDVNLKLSTSNPSRSNIKPVLPPWYITYYTGIRESKIPSMARTQSDANTGTITMDDETQLNEKMKELTIAQSAANYSQLVETMTNVEFEIKLPYTIPSDGVNHSVSVKTSELPATYFHYLIPKLDSEAFLLAKVTGWEELNLLPGNANIFYEGTYVGATVINPLVINDTLELALGRDNGIMVTRTRMPVKESNKLLGSDVTRTIAYEIRMKNNKSKPINLVVEDQIPLSKIKEIKVELKDHGKAVFNEGTGLLKWDLALDSKAYKSLKFSYEVTSNKDMPLSMY